MRISERSAQQMRTISWLHDVLTEHGIEYWLFGGWAVDFHAGQVSREHEDVDIAIWRSDLGQLAALLPANGWTHTPQTGEDGYTAYQRGGVRVEFAVLDRDEDGVIYSPLVDGRGEWPATSFGDVVAFLDGTPARVVGLTSLIEDKSGPREDPLVSAKDLADVAVLTRLVSGDGAQAGP